MGKPAVTVIIPTHNRLNYLVQALDSVARQTFQDFETIVVDDGSDAPVAPQVADHPTRPRVIRQTRGGPAAARNRGIEAAEADLIAFLDSDDVWLPTKLERFAGALKENPEVSIFHGPMSAMDAAGNPMGGRCKPRHGGWITRRLFASCFVDVPTVVCRKALLERMGGFDASLPVCEDYDLWLRISVREPFGLIEEPLSRRRLHDNRLSKSRMSRNLEVKAGVLRRFHEAHRQDGLLDEQESCARLSRVFFVAARAAYRNKEYAKAVDLCRAGRSYGRAPLRSWLICAAANARARFAGQRLQSESLVQTH